VEIIAHRGSPRQHPENSIPGFVLAARAGVGGLELDVHRTRDGSSWSTTIQSCPMAPALIP